VQLRTPGLQVLEELPGGLEGPSAHGVVHLARGVVEVAADQRPLGIDAAQEVRLEVAAPRLEDHRPLPVPVAVDAHVLVVEVPEDVGGLADRPGRVDPHAHVGAALPAIGALLEGGGRQGHAQGDRPDAHEVRLFILMLYTAPGPA
jgi:hypothetical protein